MDVDVTVEERNDTTKSCFRLEAKVYEPLHISNYLGTIVLWNRFQLFLYNNCDFSVSPVSFEPQFKVLKVLPLDSCLLCLDFDGNIHRVSLNIPVTNEPLQIPFRPLLQNVHAFVELDDLYILNITRCEAFTLGIYKKSNLDKVIQKYKLDIPTENIKTKEDIILKAYKLTERSKVCMDIDISEGYLIVIVVDGRHVYTKVLNTEMDFPSKLLYSVPSDIRDLLICDAQDINLAIALKSGTVVKLSFSEKQKIQVYHLNIPIMRMLAINQTLYYSDGNTMWQSQTLNQGHFRQIFVKYPRDFVKINNTFICTTYSNAIYKFCYDDNIFISDEKEDDKQPVEKFLSGYGFLEDLYYKNVEITTKIQKERLHYTAIALSNHLDKLITCIDVNIGVFDNYIDAAKSNVTLTNELSDYFKPNLTILSINMTLKDGNEDIINIFTNLKTIRLHIVVNNNSETRMCFVKNVTFKDTFLVPVYNVNIPEFKVSLKLTCPIETTNGNEPIWIVLLDKQLSVSIDNFIKVGKKNTDAVSIKSELSFEQLVLKILDIQHGLLFNINIPEAQILKHKFVKYIKLKGDYENRLIDRNNYKNVKEKVVEKFIKEFSNKNFYTNPNHIIRFDINQYLVLLEIVKDKDCFLKITSENAKVCFLIRKLFYDILKDGNLQIDNIPYYQYKALKELILKLKLNNETQNEANMDELVLDVADEFHRKYLSEFPTS